MIPKPLNYIPLGSMHPRFRCARCGKRVDERPMHVEMLFVTHAEAMVCDDPVACHRTAKKKEKNA